MIEHVCKLAFLLSVTLALGGCGGYAQKYSPPPAQSSNDIAGNWQIDATSSASGTPAFSFAGSVNQSQLAVASALHVSGSNCFNPLTTINLSGKQGGGKLSLSSAPVDGQVVTFAGILTDLNLTGTYTIEGGCADGDHGTVTGVKIPQINGTWDGVFTNSGNKTFDGVVQVTQGSGTPEGAFAATGSASFTATCFTSGTIVSGAFPTGSYIIGTSVNFAIETTNGTLEFQGTADESIGQIVGSYAIAGSSCNENGTAVLTLNDPWGY